MKLEVCVDSVESSIAAAKGGAERIELCSALSEDGITPSVGLIDIVRRCVDIDVFVIIRPRGGSFVYSEPELEVMRSDISAAKTRGVNGVVLGLLNEDGTIDRPHTTELIELARPMEVTFHRAFDASQNLSDALEDVIACGADRLLTAGGPSDAMNNLDSLAALQAQAAGRIRIMAGGGIRIGNVREIALRTGIAEMHTSLNSKGQDSGFDGGGGPDTVRDAGYYVVKQSDVEAFRSALREISVRS
ncbi:copper homeostasis protein CutC [Occallatibacter riparius]|uniref:PF03932 family protein CutC n=1 Tax=Occallatibacter riparius TaxID=1002689 RepID=A0A9J7BSJ4_9BACT|nr:copper homeostasis protein CutC [Occallatibacter riparius]UWZ85553.1 copper homeostasis protein CutC [Occallatibacter riparius]